VDPLGQSSEDAPAALRALEDRIRSHPVTRLHMELGAFYTSIVHVFRVNGSELDQLLGLPEQDVPLAIELIQNVRPSTAREGYAGHVTRSLHNYLASSFSLVDHSRRLRDRTVASVSEEFGQRVKAARADHQVMSFMQGLRNFLLHRNLPSLSAEWSVDNVNTPEQRETYRTYIAVDDLSEWGGWNAADRAFLREHTAKGLNLRPLVAEHSAILLELNTWLHDAVMRRIDLAEVNDLVTQRNAVLMGVDYETARQHTLRRDAVLGLDPQPSDEVGGVDLQSGSDLADIDESDVPLAPLDAPDVGAIQSDDES
jgi:hypothetical protein